MIRFRNVEFSYAKGKAALVASALDIGPGLTVVLGPNGAGKSTLLRIAAGVDRPLRGHVTVDGHDLWTSEEQARRHLAYVPEHPELTPYATIADVMHLVARLRGAELATVVEALGRVGMLDIAGRTIRELSMGQRRRALFATALIGDLRTVILDEPLETMDLAMRDLICDRVRQLRARGATVVIATHELAPFASDLDAAVAIQDGSPLHVPVAQLGVGSERIARLNTLASRH